MKLPDNHQPIIGVDSLRPHLEDPDWLLVDCRFSLADTEAGRLAYLEEHPPGALYAHLDLNLSGDIVKGKTGRHPMPEADTLAATFAAWGIDERVQVVAYDDATGPFAARLWWLLLWLGHDRVSVLDGGLPAYRAAGLPLTPQSTIRAPRLFVPRVREAMAIDVDGAAAFARAADHRLVDSRAHDRYLGKVEPIDPVAGHIPGAMNLPFDGNLGEGGKLRPAATLRERFEPVIGDCDLDRVAFYCGSGVTAAQNILSCAHAGLGIPRMYPGSWSEWITDPARPVATGEEGA